jgi:hypothetical protein
MIVLETARSQVQRNHPCRDRPRRRPARLAGLKTCRSGFAMPADLARLKAFIAENDR